MTDVSTSTNQVENHNRHPFIKFLKVVVKIVTPIIVISALITLAALISISNHLIKVENDMRQAYLIELLSQILNGSFALLSLTVVHTRIIPFIAILQLLSKSEDDKSIYYIKKQKLIKKYASWYDDRCVSLSYLLVIYILWMLNILFQAIITMFLIVFSTYKDGIVVLPMITLRPRPMALMAVFVVGAISSSIIIGILAGYKMYQVRKIRKLDSNNSAV